MTDRWERLTDLYHAAVALSEDERASLLTEACLDDPALQADVQRLVAAHDRARESVEPLPVEPPAVEPPAVEPPTVERPDPEPADAGPDPVTDRCGPYRLLKEIDRGRLGTVYLAARDDGRFDQRVTIELIERERDASLVLDRVRAAHHDLCSRDHPNIARLIAAATREDGQAYVVMEYVDGEPIDAFADGSHLSIAERLELFVVVCNAVSYAHRCRVIHGALSPASIRITRGAVPKLLSFGMADQDAMVVDDIRSLGVVLDTLLGSEVSKGSRRRLRGDLDTVVRTALGRDARRRYVSVEELADDVRRSLDRLAAQVRPDTRPERQATSASAHRRAVLAWAVAGIAFVTLGLKVAPLATRRVASVPVAPPVEVATQRQRVLVADFADHVGEPQLVAALSDAFRTGLTESPSVVVLSARRQRVDAEVTGSIDTVGKGYSIMVQVARSEKAARLSALVETATDPADVMRALGRVAEQLREQLGEPSASITATPRLVEVTSPSLAALRSYASASRVIAGGDRAGGLRLLRTAVSLDTGFAAAHRLMSLTYADMGDRERSADALDHAIANQTRLPFSTRYHTVASHATTVLAQYAPAIDAYNRILERYPDDVRALTGLAFAHAARREYAVQESLLVRAIAVDSGVPSLLTGLAFAQVNQGKYGAARRALDRAERRFPGTRANDLAEIAIAASKQDWESAEREASARIAQGSSDTLDALDGLEILAGIRMTQGRLADAERDLRRVVASGPGRVTASRALTAALRLAYVELRYRHSSAAALRTMNAALARFPLARMPESERPYDEAARFFADAGQPARAHELIAQSARTRLARRLAGDANRRWTLGAIAMAEGRAWEGEIEIHAAAEAHPCPICALPDLARAYEVAGKPDSAIATYERYLRTSWQRRFETDAVELGFAMERLGALYQKQRDDARAGELYTALLQLWRAADPELEPLLTDVRRRLDQTSSVAASR